MCEGTSLKRVLDTRWSAHYDSTCAIIGNYKHIIAALSTIVNGDKMFGKEQGRIKAGADGAAAPGPPTKIGLSITTYYKQLSDFFINQLFYFKVEYELPIFIGLIYPV